MQDRSTSSVGLSPSASPPLADASDPPSRSDGPSDSPVTRGRRTNSEATELEDRGLEAGQDQDRPSIERLPLRRLATSERQAAQRFAGLRRFWRHHVSVNVPHVDCRDHLALERTYLGYFRTATTLSMSAVVVAQLFPLQPSGQMEDQTITFPKLAKPLAVLLVASSIVVTLLGTMRVWRQQNAMVRGKIITASWETIFIGLLAATLMMVLFIFTLIVEPGIKGPIDF